MSCYLHQYQEKSHSRIAGSEHGIVGFGIHSVVSNFFFLIFFFLVDIVVYFFIFHEYPTKCKRHCSINRNIFFRMNLALAKLEDASSCSNGSFRICIKLIRQSLGRNTLQKRVKSPNFLVLISFLIHHSVRLSVKMSV